MLLFAIVGTIVAAAAIFVFGELLLRAFAYGYPSRFYLQKKINASAAVVDNPRFGWRFFPPTIARRPHDTLLAAKKPDDEMRIFVFGESAAWGDPDPGFGFWRMLQVLLDAQFPGTNVRVINAAMAAINSHVVVPIAREAAKHNPDLFVIYMGNNEVIGPYGPGTAFAGFLESLPAIRTSIAARSLKWSQLVVDTAARIKGPQHQPQEWAGMQMFEKNKLPANDPRLQRMYSHFAANLGDIIDSGRDAGADVLLCTMAANLKNCGPFASLHRDNLTEQENAEGQRHFDVGTSAIEARRFPAAITAFSAAAKIDETHAATQFLLARALEMNGDFARAKTHYQKALEHDALRFRSDAGINAAIRDAARTKKVQLVDIVQAFDAESTGGIPGASLLVDHVHMNFHGNYIIARELAQRTASLIAKRLNKASTNRIASEEEVAARLAFTGWNRLRVAERNLQRVKNPPFTNQPDNAEQRAMLQTEVEELSHHSSAEALQEAEKAYEVAITSAPQDWILHENYADLLQHAGRSAEETRELRKVMEFMPHHQERNAWLGQSLANQGKHQEAIDAYKRALEHDSTNVAAHRGLAEMLVRTGQTEQGLKQYRTALKARPGNAENQNLVGEAFLRMNRIPDAEAAFKRATELKPNYAAAHANLGALYWQQKKIPLAEAALKEALALEQDSVLANRVLGNLYMETQQPAKAIQPYEQVLKKPPVPPDIYNNLAAAYAFENRPADAINLLRTAAKMQPDEPQIHKNLGLMLLQSGIRSEAAYALRRAQELAPNDTEVANAIASMQSPE